MFTNSKIAWVIGLCVAGSACHKDKHRANPDPSAGPERNPKVTGYGGAGMSSVGPVTGAPSPFSFESGSDEQSLALQAVLTGFVGTPRTAAEAEQLAAERVAAIARLAADPEPAAQAIITDLDNAPTDQAEPFMTGFYLLAEFPSTSGTQYLYARATQAGPADVGGPTDDAPVGPRLQRYATVQLSRLAVSGSALAKTKLLDVIANGAPGVRQAAIRGYLGATIPAQRWRAKRELARVLAPQDQYLIYQIY